MSCIFNVYKVGSGYLEDRIVINLSEIREFNTLSRNCVQNRFSMLNNVENYCNYSLKKSDCSLQIRGENTSMEYL